MGLSSLGSPLTALAANDSIEVDNENSELIEEVDIDVTYQSLKYQFPLDEFEDNTYEPFSVPVKEHPGSGITYQLIKQFNSTSYLGDSLQAFSVALGTAAAAAKIQNYSEAASKLLPLLSAAFYRTPAQKYYTTKMYARTANGNMYFRVVHDVYSNSARTKRSGDPITATVTIKPVYR